MATTNGAAQSYSSTRSRACDRDAQKVAPILSDDGRVRAMAMPLNALHVCRRSTGACGVDCEIKARNLSDARRARTPDHHRGERLRTTSIARNRATYAERFGRHDRSVDQAQAEIREASIHFHRTRKLTNGRRCIGERAAGEIVHEHSHRPAFVAKEVVDLGEHEGRNVPGAA